MAVLTAGLVIYAYLTALPGFSFLLIPLLYAAGVLGLIWLLSLVRAAFSGGLRPLTRFTRWAVIAVVAAAVVLAGWYGAFLRLGFELSRAALETAASNPGASGLAGIYPIADVSTTPHGSTVWVGWPAGLIDDVGFHRSTLGSDGGDCEEGGWAHQLDSQWSVVGCTW